MEGRDMGSVTNLRYNLVLATKCRRLVRFKESSNRSTMRSERHRRTLSY